MAGRETQEKQQSENWSRYLKGKRKKKDKTSSNKHQPKGRGIRPSHVSYNADVLRWVNPLRNRRALGTETQMTPVQVPFSSKASRTSQNPWDSPTINGRASDLTGTQSTEFGKTKHHVTPLSRRRRRSHTNSTKLNSATAKSKGEKPDRKKGQTVRNRLKHKRKNKEERRRSLATNRILHSEE